jgi:hypothetical protein
METHAVHLPDVETTEQEKKKEAYQYGTELWSSTAPELYPGTDGHHDSYERA